MSTFCRDVCDIPAVDSEILAEPHANYLWVSCIIGDTHFTTELLVVERFRCFTLTCDDAVHTCVGECKSGAEVELRLVSSANSYLTSDAVEALRATYEATASDTYAVCG